MLTKPCLTHSFQNSSVPGFPGSDSSQILPVHNVWRAFKSPKKIALLQLWMGRVRIKPPEKPAPAVRRCATPPRGFLFYRRQLLSQMVPIASHLYFSHWSLKCWWVDLSKNQENDDSPWKSMIVQVDFPSYLGTPIFLPFFDKFFLMF